MKKVEKVVTVQKWFISYERCFRMEKDGVERYQALMLKELNKVLDLKYLKKQENDRG